MKYLLNLISILLCIQLAIAQPQKDPEWSFSGSLSIGLNIPQTYESDADELSFLSIASQTISNPGFRVSGTAYYGKVGFNLGFGHYKYVFNAEKFENESKSRYADDSIGVYMSAKMRDIPVFAGLSYYLKIKEFIIEPEFIVRYNKVIAPDYADIYFWSENNLIESISYLKKASSRFDLVPGIKLNYLYALNNKRQVGIQFSYHYAIANPELEYLKREVDIENKIVTEKIEKAKMSYTTSNFSFGLVFRFN